MGFILNFLMKMRPLKKTLAGFFAPLVMTAGLSLSAVNSAIADDNKLETQLQRNEPKKCRLVEKGVLVSYGYGNVNNQKTDGPYEVSSVMGRLGWDIKPFVEDKLHLHPKGKLTGLVEPFTSAVTSPDNNFEVGLNLLAKYNFRNENKKPVSWLDKIDPYIEGGFGAIYASQDFKYQSTKGNFLVQVGAGLDYNLNDDFLVFVGVRRRHFSNAKIQQPNRGVDINQLIVGGSWKF